MAKLTGHVTESGPDYTYNGGVCGRAPNAVEHDGSDLWFTDQTGTAATAPILVELQASTVRTHDGGCSAPHIMVGVADPGNLTYATEAGPRTLSLHRDGSSLVAGAGLLEAGGTLTWHLHWELDHTPTTHDKRDGHYVYDGDLTLTYVGAVAEDRLHHVETCDKLPSGC